MALDRPLSSTKDTSRFSKTLIESIGDPPRPLSFTKGISRFCKALIESISSDAAVVKGLVMLRSLKGYATPANH